MLLTDARRAARTGPDGELIPLAEQDRSLWDRALIAEGIALITRDARRAARSARTSCRPRSRRCTTRRRAPRTPTGRRSSRSTACSSGCPTTRWSRSTARSRPRWCTGRAPASRCSTRSAADPRLRGHYRLDAVRAHLLEMAGDRDAAVADYLAAARRHREPSRAQLPDRAGRAARADAPLVRRSPSPPPPTLGPAGASRPATERAAASNNVHAELAPGAYAQHSV